MNRHRIYGLVVVVALLVGVAVAVSAQTPRGPATLDDLLTEVQGLRADLARSSTASVRVQVLTARLSLQEERINTLNGQLAEQQARFDEASARRRAAEDGIKQIETSLTSNALPLEVQKDVEGSMAGRKMELSRLQASEQQIGADMAALSSVIATQQSQWTDFSNRLDELERSLSGR
jgi:uncharacterized coiled-coil protein SlyX